ncbi:hypothetical protein UA36_10525 [Photobacterium angustum]|nr:hypothetical protein UA39_16440 [Photobacterium angustum]KJG31001.1 hypothetical protein UA36_10525 [Photobacterium angustum]PSW95518.1 hypothetical protein C0W79_11725 [Photobacterium angustum]
MTALTIAGGIRFKVKVIKASLLRNFMIWKSSQKEDRSVLFDMKVGGGDYFCFVSKNHHHCRFTYRLRLIRDKA